MCGLIVWSLTRAVLYPSRLKGEKGVDSQCGAADEGGRHRRAVVEVTEGGRAQAATLSAVLRGVDGRSGRTRWYGPELVVCDMV